MKQTIFSAILLITLLIFGIISDVALIKTIDHYTNAIANESHDPDALFQDFKKKEKWMSLILSKEELREVEIEFSDYVQLEDEETKNRLCDTLGHLRRLSLMDTIIGRE